MRKDHGNKQGLLPHIASWTQTKNRLEKINNLVLLTRKNNPEFLFDFEKNKVSIINRKSLLPQIIDLRCENNNLKSYILKKNELTEVEDDLIKNCKLNEINFSINNGKNFSKINEFQKSQRFNFIS